MYRRLTLFWCGHLHAAAVATVDAGARVVATTVGAGVARLAIAAVWPVETNTHATQDSCPTAPVRLSNVDGR